MSERYAREFHCPDPDEHGEIVFVVGVMRPPSIRRRFPQRWERLDPAPACPICGKQMVHDDERLTRDLEAT